MTIDVVTLTTQTNVTNVITLGSQGPAGSTTGTNLVGDSDGTLVTNKHRHITGWEAEGTPGGYASYVDVEASGFFFEEAPYENQDPAGNYIVAYERTTDLRPKSMLLGAQGAFPAATTFLVGGGFDFYGGRGAVTGGTTGSGRFWYGGPLTVGADTRGLTATMDEDQVTVAVPLQATRFVIGTPTGIVNDSYDPAGTAQETYFTNAATNPSLTSGTGAPAAAENNGSVYLRTNGSSATAIYSRQAGAWVAVGGAVIPTGTGFTRITAGVQEAAAFAVDLAGGATYVTGVLPEANQADQTMGGDSSGSTSANANHSLTGASSKVVIRATAPSLEWVQATAAPGLAHAQQANASAPANLSVTPQAPGAAATNATNGTPGSHVVSLAAPVNGGSEAGLRVHRAGTVLGTMQGLVGSPTSFGAVYLGAGFVPSSSNYTLASDGGQAFINASSGSSLRVAGADAFTTAATLNTSANPVAIGTGPFSTAGAVRLPYLASGTLVGSLNSVGTDMKVITAAAGNGLTYGDDVVTAYTQLVSAGFIVVNAAASASIYFKHGATLAGLFEGSNFSIGPAGGSYGGGVGVFCMQERTTTPTTNPTGASVTYVEGGATKVRSPSGVVTTIAVA